MKEVHVHTCHTYSEAYINIRSIYVVWVLCYSDEAKFNAIELIYEGDRSNVQGYNNVTNTVVTMETHRAWCWQICSCLYWHFSSTSKSMGLSPISQQTLKRLIREREKSLEHFTHCTSTCIIYIKKLIKNNLWGICFIGLLKACYMYISFSSSINVLLIYLYSMHDYVNLFNVYIHVHIHNPVINLKNEFKVWREGGERREGNVQVNLSLQSVPWTLSPIDCYLHLPVSAPACLGKVGNLQLSLPLLRMLWLLQWPHAQRSTDPMTVMWPSHGKMKKNQLLIIKLHVLLLLVSHLFGSCSFACF